MKRLRSFGFSLVVWCFSFLIFWLVSFGVENLAYPAALVWFPDLVPEYNFVNEREKYELLYAVLRVISAGITALVVSYISVRHDNERFEYMISKTEGMYTMSEGCRLYFGRYIFIDLIIAVLIPTVTVLLEAQILPLLSMLPEGVIDMIRTPLAVSSSFISLLGGVGAVILLSALIFGARLLAGLYAIDRFRVVWLSDIQYLG